LASPGLLPILVFIAALVISTLEFQPSFKTVPAVTQAVVEIGYSSDSTAEFGMLFRILYGSYPTLLIGFFFALLIACVSVVTLLTLRALQNGQRLQQQQLSAPSRNLLGFSGKQSSRKVFFFTDNSVQYNINSIRS